MNRKQAAKAVAADACEIVKLRVNNQLVVICTTHSDRLGAPPRDTTRCQDQRAAILARASQMEPSKQEVVDAVEREIKCLTLANETASNGVAAVLQDQFKSNVDDMDAEELRDMLVSEMESIAGWAGEVVAALKALQEAR